MSVDEIFGKGSHIEIGNVTTIEKMVEIIVEMSETEQQFEEWERLRREAKRRQSDNRRLNLFWRRNKTFPAQYGGDECHQRSPQCGAETKADKKKGEV